MDDQGFVASDQNCIMLVITDGGPYDNSGFDSRDGRVVDDTMATASRLLPQVVETNDDVCPFDSTILANNRNCRRTQPEMCPFDFSPPYDELTIDDRRCQQCPHVDDLIVDHPDCQPRTPTRRGGGATDIGNVILLLMALSLLAITIRRTRKDATAESNQK